VKTTTTLITASVCTTALAWSASPLADDDFITLASTTSTENSGLFDAIIPTFTEAAVRGGRLRHGAFRRHV
jgi:tungstate transport system substrate-binding protein